MSASHWASRCRLAVQASFRCGCGLRQDKDNDSVVKMQSNESLEYHQRRRWVWWSNHDMPAHIVTVLLCQCIGRDRRLSTRNWLDDTYVDFECMSVDSLLIHCPHLLMASIYLCSLLDCQLIIHSLPCSCSFLTLDCHSSRHTL